jgi:large repetitive protein
VTLPYAPQAGGSVAHYELLGTESGATALVPITLASFYPTLTPSTYYAAPGSTASLSGAGFAPNESVTVSSGTGSSTTVLANGEGTFSPTSLTMPTTGNTTAHITATGALSGATATIAITIAPYYPSVTPSEWFGRPMRL